MSPCRAFGLDHGLLFVGVREKLGFGPRSADGMVLEERESPKLGVAWVIFLVQGK